EMVLRRSDIIMQSGNNRYFILLPELKEKDLDSVTERIMSKWETTEFYAVTDVTYVAETVSYLDERYDKAIGS
ncbi:MAG: hypothetical protein IJ075_01750, partial [Lachnospiraceae bacterium]|nr:hypothetical protein [Lachnospiraceae bacterium]